MSWLIFLDYLAKDFGYVNTRVNILKVHTYLGAYWPCGMSFKILQLTYTCISVFLIKVYQVAVNCV